MDKRAVVSILAAGHMLLLTPSIAAAAAALATPVPLADAAPCPATLPNGSTPPGELSLPTYHGNVALWVVLAPGGIEEVMPEDVSPNGSISTKRPWWRLKWGSPLSVAGRRLDAPAPPLAANIPAGYDAWVQATVLDFPAVGCWEVTGPAAEASLTFVTELDLVDDATTPGPGATPGPEEKAG